MPILDAELGRLPAKHRDVLILCLLNGASPEEAAVQLGCPVGTVKSRLARGREALRGRLTTRGIAPAIVLAAVSSQEVLASPVSPMLARATLELLDSNSIAPGILTLTKGAFPSMLPKSVVMSSLLLGGVAVAGLGAAIWLNSTSAQEARRTLENPGHSPRSGAPREAQTTNNMKQILLAFHNYHSANGRFPALANFGTDGLPKLSWRVAVLPFLDENELFNEFRQDEPWDSLHNKALIERMPAVFQTPDSPAPAGMTRIRGFAGKGAMFEGTRGVGLEEVTDGTSNTVLIANARNAVIWTQPGELPFGEGQPLPDLDASNPQGYTLGMADGSVRRLPGTEYRLLARIITRAGGEVIAWPASESVATTGRTVTTAPQPQTTPPVFLPTAPQATPAPAPGPGMVMGSDPPRPLVQNPQALEQRMQRVEEKLDLLLQKLDRVFPDRNPSRR